MEPERYIYINTDRTVMVELWVDLRVSSCRVVGSLVGPLKVIPAEATIVTRLTSAHIWSPPLELFLEKG